jgi:hypothetical protein
MTEWALGTVQSTGREPGDMLAQRVRRGGACGSNAAYPSRRLGPAPVKNPVNSPSGQAMGYGL